MKLDFWSSCHTWRQRTWDDRQVPKSLRAKVSLNEGKFLEDFISDYKMKEWNCGDVG